MTMNIPARKPTTTPPQDEAELVAMALSPVPKSQLLNEMSMEKIRQQTPSQAAEQSVSMLLASAIAKSSCIDITKEQSDALTADFADADFLRGAGGNADLIYIDQSALRQRFNKVLGMGQWSIITIRSWSEDYKTDKGKEAARVYCEAALLIKGALAGRAIGSMDYFKGNAMQNYGDAYEGAKTNAFRRCAKDAGVGLQAYSKDWCEQWKAKYAGFNRPTR